jgi:hypothetical protein
MGHICATRKYKKYTVSVVREILCLAALHVHEASNYGPARPCHNLNSCRACCKLRYLEGKFNDNQRNAQLVRVKYHMP